jgi:DNA polymerase-1
MNTLVLIDGKNAIYRFGYAHSTLTSASRPTGAVFGILGALVRLKRRYPDAQFVMVWDGPGDSWRHRVFPEYKASRRIIAAAAAVRQTAVVKARSGNASVTAAVLMPETKAEREKREMRNRVLAQIPVVQDIARRIGIPQVEVAGVEADDLIGMAAVMHRAFGGEVVVYSSDKDFCQLMTIGVKIIRPQPFAEDRPDVLAVETEESIQKLFGCLPGEVLAVRAYAGDKSDGIPVAIPGIGIKRALECVRAGADPAKDELKCADLKIMKKVRGGWAAVRRNYTLMQIAASPDPKLFGDAVAKEAQAGLRRATEEILSWSKLRADKDGGRVRGLYLGFVGALVEMDLYEALHNRDVLWNIQSVRTAKVA